MGYSSLAGIYQPPSWAPGVVTCCKEVQLPVTSSKMTEMTAPQMSIAIHKATVTNHWPSAHVTSPHLQGVIRVTVLPGVERGSQCFKHASRLLTGWAQAGMNTGHEYVWSCMHETYACADDLSWCDQDRVCTQVRGAGSWVLAGCCVVHHGGS